ncbi:gluconate 2-dehydrogenase subunit 3 family protein [Maribacter hydrothermalis]|uniref:Gluconate 2-dehydrogenase subunit 3 n=1 Tax=Maribacter hydrothermalis TaxID=1836467 RepID=A0A1B7Z1R5_9FLAO|nr:gluconate 2-dehydrogenase subunit 3 family protein [Maribacter hydrothermalis]APQ18309.1 hypothetical protein BTR34_13665 [Maribacter hydrothermalis]OBR36655.1 hypothetical protein A9200_09560 [Maribacter hydrothermalis]
MKRSTFLNRISLGTGGLLIIPAVSLVQSCSYRPTLRTTISASDSPLLDEIGETIIPTTDAVPGAKAANIGSYMVLMYEDCMTPEDQQLFVEGINELDQRASQTYGESFTTIEDVQKLELLYTIQNEAEAYYLTMEGLEKVPVHYFSLLKNLTISGYFSSKIGMMEARNYVPIPGKFESCIPYSKYDKPWAI